MKNLNIKKSNVIINENVIDTITDWFHKKKGLRTLDNLPRQSQIQLKNRLAAKQFVRNVDPSATRHVINRNQSMIDRVSRQTKTGSGLVSPFGTFKMV